MFVMFSVPLVTYVAHVLGSNKPTGFTNNISKGTGKSFSLIRGNGLRVHLLARSNTNACGLTEFIEKQRISMRAIKTRLKKEHSKPGQVSEQTTVQLENSLLSMLEKELKELQEMHKFFGTKIKALGDAIEEARGDVHFGAADPYSGV